MVRKKKLLFVIDSLHAAGAEKSLITLLSCFDFSKYQIDLFLLSNTGELISQIQQDVHLIEHDEKWIAFGYPLLKSLRFFLLKGEIKLLFHRLLFTLKSHMNRKGQEGQEGQQKLWKHISPALPKIYGEYDVAIAYLEKYPIYTIVEKVDASVKIGWIHNDYKSYGLSRKFDILYFNKLDYIVTISEKCSKILYETFPEFSHKISVIENIVSPELLSKLAEEPCNISKCKGIIIVTLARLIYQKGIDMAVETAKMLHDNGVEFNWYVLGEGPEREKLTKMIKKYGLVNKFYLLGVRSNPYSYIKNCDIYVQSSRFEGKSIALEEVKAICRPVIVTKYPTVIDQFTDRFDCIMTEVTAEGIYEGIKEMLENDGIRDEICNNIKKQRLGNVNEINKLYALFSFS